MTGFGEQLRSEREGRGLSLEALCANTKVQQKHLQALEEEEYEVLPGGVFRRGIVRAYLAATGLDEAEWMARFQESFAAHERMLGREPDAGSDSWVEFAENVRRSRVGSGRRNGLRWLGVAVLLVVILAAASGVWLLLLRGR